MRLRIDTMNTPDVVRKWVASNYQETDEEMDIVKVSDMYLYFTYSDEYKELPTLAKKTLNPNQFILFLERYYVRNDRKMIKRIRYTKRVHYLRSM
jgi:hypothetical protein